MVSRREVWHVDTLGTSMSTAARRLVFNWHVRRGSRQYREHIRQYGHPSEFGFKDVINEWKAEKWDPEAIVALYKRTGAKYFVALANHHDNMDLWDSKYQRNSVMGPRRTSSGVREGGTSQRLALWRDVHAAARLFHEPARLADTSGPKEGVPYDGRLMKEDGVVPGGKGTTRRIFALKMTEKNIP